MYISNTVGKKLSNHKQLIKSVLYSLYAGNKTAFAENDSMKVEARHTTEETLGISIVFKGFPKEGQ